MFGSAFKVGLTLAFYLRGRFDATCCNSRLVGNFCGRHPSRAGPSESRGTTTRHLTCTIRASLVHALGNTEQHRHPKRKRK